MGESACKKWIGKTIHTALEKEFPGFGETDEDRAAVPKTEAVSV
jgi:hypothetical protein